MDSDIAGIILVTLMITIFNIAVHLIVNDWKGKE
jgi:hypothetical protein